VREEGNMNPHLGTPGRAAAGSGSEWGRPPGSRAGETSRTAGAGRVGARGGAGGRRAGERGEEER